MFTFITAPASSTNEIILDLNSDMPEYCYLESVTLIPDDASPPRYGDWIELDLVTVDGETVTPIRQLGKYGVDPSRQTYIATENGSEGTYVSINGGAQLRARYHNVSLLLNSKVILNANCIA